jgi:hypothetical protein
LRRRDQAWAGRALRAIAAALACALGSGCSGGSATRDADEAPALDADVETDRDADVSGDADRDAAPPDADPPSDADSPAPCEPPDHAMVGGECLPSCGTAGGNRCETADSTMCEGLPLLPSYDCPVCCARPGYPGPVGASSFHFVYEGDEPTWDSILALSLEQPTVLLVALERPDEVPPDRWVKSQHTSFAPSGAEMARTINSILVDPATAPVLVMVDELNESTVDYVAELANVMRTRYPQWEGRWGAFTTVFTGGQPAIDELLMAHAHIGVERYIDQQWYCDQGDTVVEHDLALARFFDGDETMARFHWLVERRAYQSSRSPLTVLFGVTDRWMNGDSPAIYLDRMFYVWVTRTRHPEALAIENGGPGAWKWTPRHVEGGYGTTNTSRDLAFVESVRWYSIDGHRDSRLGQVPCD